MHSEECTECGLDIPLDRVYKHRGFHEGIVSTALQGAVDDYVHEIVEDLASSDIVERWLVEARDFAQDQILDLVPWFVRWLVKRRLVKEE